jgi:hydrogenase expression/formation protein HypD
MSPEPERIREGLRALTGLLGPRERPARFMEVCGTHTVSLFRSGLRSLLPAALRLISGPGCPVCVTDQAEIDGAVELASRGDLILASFGDMLRVPGSRGSLASARAEGADVRVVTSAAEALRIAEEVSRPVVFLGVGFETTAPTTAIALQEARRRNRTNFSVLCLHKTVPAALEALASDRTIRVEGFLLPGHVSSIIGLAPYAFLAERHRIGGAVAGFEPLEILAGLLELARQLRTGRPEIRSLYARAVRPEGNPSAIRAMEAVFEPVDARWRGLGTIPGSGLSLREEYRDWDARFRFGLSSPEEVPPPRGCRCGDVLRGVLDPPDCPLFGRACTPGEPVGPCMVSGEGSCAAHYRYARKGMPQWES